MEARFRVSTYRSLEMGFYLENWLRGSPAPPWNLVHNGPYYYHRLPQHHHHWLCALVPDECTRSPLGTVRPTDGSFGEAEALAAFSTVPAALPKRPEYLLVPCAFRAVSRPSTPWD
jgi:hypothetical protein